MDSNAAGVQCVDGEVRGGGGGGGGLQVKGGSRV